MANPDTPPEGFPSDPRTALMFKAQEDWSTVLTVLRGQVEQTRQAGFTDVQAHAMVAAALVSEVAVSAFVGAPKRDGDR
ncbi:hypothetical protein Q8791_23590 [Nocardiopsis sp. CT-R113]|uniref:Uncharacterized protein n=1 Tax=Nocardiopsis codii TaxID=3065942 RepID=A0ABU7KD97_9ACTN|nr:hypothetical protein [Nocardiopsis sp. CT-R113]MEE2040205.1 hypothetical protein [Nocardiopsis sp. CT-R113]